MACLVWSDLHYNGDSHKFLETLDGLVATYPLNSDALVQMATKPFSREFVSQVKIIAAAQGPGKCLPYQKLRDLIENHLKSQRQSYRRQADAYQFRADHRGDVYPVAGAASPNDSSHFSSRFAYKDPLRVSRKGVLCTTRNPPSGVVRGRQEVPSLQQPRTNPGEVQNAV